MTAEDLMQLYLSLPECMKASDLFDINKSTGPAQANYEFKGFIGFMGAHYVSYFRTLESDQFYDLSLSESL